MSSTLSDTRHPAAARRVLDLTRRLIAACGPRPAGSDASRKCADALETEAKNFADRTATLDFTVHPGAFLGWIRVEVVLYALAVVCLWIGRPGLSALIVAAGLAIMTGQFFLYHEILDPLFPRRRGRNVWAEVEPEGEVRGELIISGHHDSARIFNFLVHQPALYPVRVMGGIGALVLLLPASGIPALAGFFGGDPAVAGRVTAGVFSVLFLLVGQLWWFASSRHTDGAGDNLASSAVAWEFLRQAVDRRDAGQGMRHLRITAASWDAEEAGLRGARAWRRSRSGESPDHPVWNLNLECLYDPRDFFLLTSDINGSVSLSADLAGRCARLMADRGREDVPVKPVEFLTGGTDAAETARAGVRSTTLMGMPWGNSQRAAVYHTPEDTLEAVSADAVSAALDLARDLAEDLDRELAD